jgi:hypothetical protein
MSEEFETRKQMDCMKLQELSNFQGIIWNTIAPPAPHAVRTRRHFRSNITRSLRYLKVNYGPTSFLSGRTALLYDGKL